MQLERLLSILVANQAPLIELLSDSRQLLQLTGHSIDFIHQELDIRDTIASQTSIDKKKW